MSGRRGNYWSTRGRQIQDHTLEVWRRLPDDLQTERKLKDMLVRSYPFMERTGYAYHMWLDERAVTLWRAGFRHKPRWLIASEQGAAPYVVPKEQLALELEGAG